MKVVFDLSGGGNAEYDVPVDRPIGDLKVEAMERFNLDRTLADKYLVACDGNKLDESKTLAELGLPENSTMILWRLGSPARTSPLDAHLMRTSSLYARF